MITGQRLDTGEPLEVEGAPGNGILIAGLTGFGKSNQINYYLYQMAMDETIAFVLCSPSSKPDYTQWLPRASSLAVGMNATDIVLDGVLAEMRRRYHDLVPYDIDEDTPDDLAIEIALASKRRVIPSPETPMLFVVVDEFVEYMKGQGGQARVNRLHTGLTISRAAGMQWCLATQRPSAEKANTDIREQMPSRVCFATDAEGAEMVFGLGGRGLPVTKIVTRGQGFALASGLRTPVPFIAPECPDQACARMAADTARFRHTLIDIPRYKDDNR